MSNRNISKANYASYKLRISIKILNRIRIPRKGDVFDAFLYSFVCQYMKQKCYYHFVTIFNLWLECNTLRFSNTH